MIEIKILFDPETGKVSINAPPNLKDFYGVLELAKDAMRLAANQRAGAILNPDGGLALPKGGG